MDNITIGQIVSGIGSVTAIAVFFIAIFKWYKSHITDEFANLNKKIDEHIKHSDKKIEVMEEKINCQDKEIQESKEERLILLKGQLACLKGLKEQGCNGPVTKAINDIENYLIDKSHE